MGTQPKGGRGELFYSGFGPWLEGVAAATGENQKSATGRHEQETSASSRHSGSNCYFIFSSDRDQWSVVLVAGPERAIVQAQPGLMVTKGMVPKGMVTKSQRAIVQAQPGLIGFGSSVPSKQMMQTGPSSRWCSAAVDMAMCSCLIRHRVRALSNHT